MWQNIPSTKLKLKLFYSDMLLTFGDKKVLKNVKKLKF